MHVESSSLPHDGEEDKKIKEYVTMKRVEAFILSEKQILYYLPLETLQATFYGSKDMGKGEKYMVSYGRGAGTTKTSYSNRSTVVTKQSIFQQRQKNKMPA